MTSMGRRALADHDAVPAEMSDCISRQDCANQGTLFRGLVGRAVTNHRAGR